MDILNYGLKLGKERLFEVEGCIFFFFFTSYELPRQIPLGISLITTVRLIALGKRVANRIKNEDKI